MFRIRGARRLFQSGSHVVRALDGVDLDVSSGVFMAVVGSSGCGKTTLLRIMAGFDHPDEGAVWLAGREVAGEGVFVRPERRNVGIVTQDGNLFPHLTVAANIAYGLRGWLSQALRPGLRRERRDRVERMLELIGMRGYGHRYPSELSGGQQQRVALARALAPNPEALLLDEPFSALDAALRADLREEVCALLSRLGTTAVLVTHDQNEALSVADHIALMREGRIVQEGTPYELYAAPSDPEAAAFLGESVELPCRVVANADGLMHVECPLGNVCVNVGAVHERDGGKVLVLRPEELELDEVKGVPADVASSSFFGHDGLARVHLADGTPLLVRMRGMSLPDVGSRVFVRLQGGSEPAAAG